MKTFLLIYLISYTVVFVVIYLAETLLSPPAERDPLWETLADVMALTIGFIGMVFVLRELSNPLIKSLWKFISVGLLGYQLWMFTRWMRARPQVIAEPNRELSSNEVTVIELAMTAFLVPSLIINLWFAFA